MPLELGQLVTAFSAHGVVHFEVTTGGTLWVTLDIYALPGHQEDPRLTSALNRGWCRAYGDTMINPLRTAFAAAWLLASTLGLTAGLAQAGAIELNETQKEEIEQKIKSAELALSLSEAQKPQFAALSRKYGTKLIEVRDGDLAMLQKARMMKSINNERNAEMKLLLTEAQFATYLKIQEEAKALTKEKMKQRGR